MISSQWLSFAERNSLGIIIAGWRTSRILCYQQACGGIHRQRHLAGGGFQQPVEIDRSCRRALTAQFTPKKFFRRGVRIMTFRA